MIVTHHIVLCSLLQVAVISAGSTLQTCLTDTCYDAYMASATIQTKKQLLDFLDGIKPEQGKISTSAFTFFNLFHLCKVLFL